jgi:polyhydroxyalkanoate synthesis regulator phasin
MTDVRRSGPEQGRAHVPGPFPARAPVHQGTEKWEVTFMFETLDRLMLAGLGALTMTRERADKMFDEMVSKGQATRETRTGFVKDVMDNAEKTRLELQRLVSDQVRQTVNNLQLATKDDVERLELKIDQLLARNIVEH